MAHHVALLRINVLENWTFLPLSCQAAKSSRVAKIRVLCHREDEQREGDAGRHAELANHDAAVQREQPRRPVPEPAPQRPTKRLHKGEDTSGAFHFRRHRKQHADSRGLHSPFLLHNLQFEKVCKYKHRVECCIFTLTSCMSIRCSYITLQRTFTAYNHVMALMSYSLYIVTCSYLPGQPRRGL